MDIMNKWTKTATTLLALGMITSTVPADTFAGTQQAPTQQTQAQHEHDYTKQLGEQNVMSVAWYQNLQKRKRYMRKGITAQKKR